MSAIQIEQLRSSIRGAIVQPGDEAYESVRVVYNRMIDKRPALIVRCVDVTARLLSSSFTVVNTVVAGINKAPQNVTRGEGPAAGEEVEISVTFDPPIILPSDHYFFRPEVDVIGGDFLYLSAPRRIVAPGTPFLPDLQAWIRNSNLKPDWLRIGTDIIDGPIVPTFNMTFSFTGDTIPGAGTPGHANCHGKSVSALAHQFGGISAAASGLGFSSVSALQDGLRAFCAE